MSSQIKYSLALRLMHWAVALLLLSMLAAGLTMVQSLATWQLPLLKLHKSFGLLALILVVLRVVIKFKDQTPDQNTHIAQIQKWGLKTVHGLMYVCMLGIPLSGLSSQFFASRPVSFFGIFTVPVSEQVDIVMYALFRESHSILAGLLITLIVLHILGVLYHYFIMKENIVKRMM